MSGNEKARFHGIDEPEKIAGRRVFRDMLVIAYSLASDCGAKEIILVDLDTGECLVGRTIVDILTTDRSWAPWTDVMVVSARNDHGHISIIYNSDC